jgi:hypothetical protein
MRPGWRNENGTAQTFSSQATSFDGPAGPSYAIMDASAHYGTVPDATVGTCQATGDCIAVSVAGARPSMHWDAVLQERIEPDTHGQVHEWTVHVGGTFTDMTITVPYYRFVETLVHHGITGGCTSTTYCPGSPTTREQVAVLLLVAREGRAYTPPACTTPIFTDVPASSPFCPWIEEIARRGVVNGCSGGMYCPAAPASREQMAVFVLLTKEPGITPPACGSPIFADVPASSPFCRWIEELTRRSIVTGCGGGNYCPARPVTREEMGVFIGATFDLTLYGP